MLNTDDSGIEGVQPGPRGSGKEDIGGSEPKATGPPEEPEDACAYNGGLWAGVPPATVAEMAVLRETYDRIVSSGPQQAPAPSGTRRHRSLSGTGAHLRRDTGRTGR